MLSRLSSSTETPLICSQAAFSCVKAEILASSSRFCCSSFSIDSLCLRSRSVSESLSFRCFFFDFSFKDLLHFPFHFEHLVVVLTFLLFDLGHGVLVGNFFCAASGYSSQFSASEVFVVNIIGHLFQVLQVGSYQHIS